MINHGIFTNVASKLGREIVMENQEMVMENQEMVMEKSCAKIVCQVCGNPVNST